MHLPPLHFSEVKSNLSVGHSLFIKITAITPDESGHIVAWKERNETGVTTLTSMGKKGTGYTDRIPVYQSTAATTFDERSGILMQH